MRYYFGRLPSFLCWVAARLSGAAEVDFVDASEAVVNGGVGAVAVLRAEAGGASVFQVLG